MKSEQSEHKLSYPEHLRHLPSATEILSIVTEKGLLDWYKTTHPSIIANTGSKTSYIGTKFNEIVDSMEHGKDVTFDDIKYKDEVVNAINSYLLWKSEKSEGLKLLDSQMVVHNKIDEYVGTVDRTYGIGNKIIIVDWKTKSGKDRVEEPMSRKEGLQLVSYAKAMISVGGLSLDDIDSLKIVRLGRKEVCYKEIELDMDSFDEYYSMFLTIKDIWRWW